MQDAGQGFRTLDRRQVGQVTSWSCGLGLASAWDPSLVGEWAAAAAAEFQAKGANVVLGPGLNVHRVPRGGRNAEYLSGEDGVLGAAFAGPYVRGFQSRGVLAVMKHIGFNQQETNRNTYSADVPSRAAHEIYYPAYRAAARAGVAAAMCAYNLVNGTHACASSGLLALDFKREMGWPGFVMSDWGAARDVAVAQGLDQDMPGSGLYDHPYSAANLRKVDPALVDAAVTRILTPMAAFGILDSFNDTCALDGGGCDDALYQRNATTAVSKSLAARVATESVLLLKNDLNVLPLDPSSARVAVVGSACAAPNDVDALMARWDLGNYYVVGGSGRVVPDRVNTVLDGIVDRLANNTTTSNKMVVAGNKKKERNSAVVRVATSDSVAAALRLEASVDVFIACGGATTTEAADRPSLLLDQSDFLTDLVTQATKPVVAVVLAPGTVLMPFADGAAAVAAIFLGGAATGNAVASVLFGDHNPSAKSPVTFPVDENAPPAPCAEARCPYAEGLHVGYRGLNGKPIRYPFGHGLSYTTFAFAWVQRPCLAVPPTTSHGGGAAFEMSVRLTNTGRRAGRDVAQLYLTYPADAGEPPHQLKAFNKTATVDAGASVVVDLTLSLEDLRIWDDVLAASTPVLGDFTLVVGASSRDNRLTATVSVSAQDVL